MNPKVRVWITAAAMLASVFLAGLLGGAALVELRGANADGAPPWVVRRPPDGERFGGRGQGGPGRRGRGLMPLLPGGLMDELGLSEEQREGVERIMRERGAEAEALLQSMYPRLRAQVDYGHAEIRELLDADQREIFDRLREEFGSRRLNVRGGPGRRPGGGADPGR